MHGAGVQRLSHNGLDVTNPHHRCRYGMTATSSLKRWSRRGSASTRRTRRCFGRFASRSGQSLRLRPQELGGSASRSPEISSQPMSVSPKPLKKEHLRLENQTTDSFFRRRCRDWLWPSWLWPWAPRRRNHQEPAVGQQPAGGPRPPQWARNFPKPTNLKVLPKDLTGRRCASTWKSGRATWACIAIRATRKTQTTLAPTAVRG